MPVGGVGGGGIGGRELITVRLEHGGSERQRGIDAVGNSVRAELVDQVDRVREPPGRPQGTHRLFRGLAGRIDRYHERMVGEFAVRRASPADIGQVTAIIALAFANDPLWGYALARPDGSTAHHADFWRLFVAGALRYPCTWLTAGGEATSIWIPPGGTEMTPGQEQQLADLATEHLGAAAGAYLELVSRFEAAHPHAEPHYYLSLLGTHPDHRGHGLGMRLTGPRSRAGRRRACRRVPGIHQPGQRPPVRAAASSDTASSATRVAARS